MQARIAAAIPNRAVAEGVSRNLTLKISCASSVSN
jgi:hypothetical protein